MLQAFSLAEALIAKNMPDAIVVEAVLPNGSGLDFCKRIKAVSSVPILFLSKLDQCSDIVAGLRVGGDEYITKPHDLGVLAARIEAQLR